MKKLMIACNIAVVAALIAVAETGAAPSNNVEKAVKLSPAEKAARMEKFYAEFGGRLVKPGTGIGCTGFIDAKSGIAAADVQTVVKTISTQLKHQQKILSCEPLNGLPTRAMVEKLGLDVGVFIVSDDNLPVMLAAPEDRWALVNITKLRKGLKDDAAARVVFSVRCRGELQRAFSYACGCGSSQYNGNLMDVTEIEQIDSLNTELTVADTTARCRKYLESIKVVAPLLVTYRAAVKQGWAPAPTNEVQKTIWKENHDKIERGPANALKIVPPKK